MSLGYPRSVKEFLARCDDYDHEFKKIEALFDEEGYTTDQDLAPGDDRLFPAAIAAIDEALEQSDAAAQKVRSW